MARCLMAGACRSPECIAAHRLPWQKPRQPAPAKPCDARLIFARHQLGQNSSVAAAAPNRRCAPRCNQPAGCAAWWPRPACAWLSESRSWPGRCRDDLDRRAAAAGMRRRGQRQSAALAPAGACMSATVMPRRAERGRAQHRYAEPRDPGHEGCGQCTVPEQARTAPQPAWPRTRFQRRADATGKAAARGRHRLGAHGGADQRIARPAGAQILVPIRCVATAARTRLPAIRRRTSPTAGSRLHPGSHQLLRPAQAAVEHFPQAAVDRLARAENARAHRSNRAIHRGRDFLVAQALELAQHDRGAQILG